MRRRPLGDCVLLTSTLVYLAVRWNKDEKGFSFDKRSTSCYGSVEDLRHLVELDSFQVKQQR